MSVDVISFSAHADFRQTSGFVEALDPAHVVLVHGEAVEMGRLRKELEKQADAAGRKCTLYTPKSRPACAHHPSPAAHHPGETPGDYCAPLCRSFARAELSNSGTGGTSVRQRC